MFTIHVKYNDDFLEAKVYGIKTNKKVFISFNVKNDINHNLQKINQNSCM